MAEEDKEVKRTSKLSSLIGFESTNFNGMQITVYYSDNNWETCEEIDLILDDNTTINQLIDAAIYKFKTELFYDDIDKKQFNVMLFKKKIKKPNDEYPICNPESLVKNYGKTHFCLVEDINTTKKEEIIKENENKDNSKNINNTKNNNKNVNKGGINEEKEKEKENNNDIKGYKTCGDKCNKCKIM